MNKRPHSGWQEGVDNWNLWYAYRVNNDLAARDSLFEGYYNQCTRILAKHVTYVDQRDQTREDAVQESAILMLTIMGEFNPMRAESFKAYIISYGTKRAIDVARTRSAIPRRAREATAIYNEAREQLSAIEGTLRSNSKPDMEAILGYAVENEMWPKWLGNPTVEKVLEAIAVRDRGLSEYSLDALASAGTANDEGRPRESVLAKVEGHEFDVIENVMISNLRSILTYILADMPEHDREVLIAFSERPLEDGTVGGAEAVRQMLQERADESLTYPEVITLEQAQKCLKEAQVSAKTSFLKNQDDILVRDSDYELLEIIQKYFESVNEFEKLNLDGSGYRSSEELTLY
jgi:RNA polymerase sigma factor (sigma-70 family)